MKHSETCEIRMKYYVSCSWSTLNQNETVCFKAMKYLESGWNSVFQGHETPRIRMKQCFMVMKHFESRWITMKQRNSWSWNILNQNETVCFLAMKHTVSWQWYTLNLFHAVSTFFTALCHAVSCCFKVIHFSVSCCFKVFHCSVSCCFEVFRCPVSTCFMIMKQLQWKRAFMNQIQSMSNN